MSYHVRRIDSNQKEITQALRDAGITVFVTSELGRGFVDLVSSYSPTGKKEDGRTYLIEIKDGNKPPSARKLTPSEQQFHDIWQDEILIIESLDDVKEFLKGLGIYESNL